MSQSEHITESGEWLSPTIDIECDPAITLNWANTVIRTFGLPFSDLNHVEYRDENGLRGIRVTQELMDLLFEQEFPYQFNYFPDEETRDWFVAAEAKDIAMIDVDGLPSAFDDYL